MQNAADVLYCSPNSIFALFPLIHMVFVTQIDNFNYQLKFNDINTLNNLK